MKYLVVLVFLLGMACGTEEEETSLQELVELDEDDFVMDNLEPRTGTTDPMLIIGNIISAINNLNTTGVDATLATLLGPLAALIPGLGGLGALGALKPVKLGVFSMVDSLLASIPALILIPVNIANMILPIVGLVLLILYLIAGNDLGALLGIGRSLSVWPSFDFDLVDNPVVESISEVFFQAMEKFDDI